MRTLSSFLDQTHAVSLYLRLNYGMLKIQKEMYCQQLMLFTLRAWLHTFNPQTPSDVLRYGSSTKPVLIRRLGFFFSNVKM